MDITELLAFSAKQGASDLHLSSGRYHSGFSGRRNKRPAIKIKRGRSLAANDKSQHVIPQRGYLAAGSESIEDQGGVSEIHAVHPQVKAVPIVDPHDSGVSQRTGDEGFRVFDAPRGGCRKSR